MAYKIAIIGGGPGGLMTAYRLQKRCSSPYEITLYEASTRLGGKIVSRKFSTAPATYEAGAAELYDYSDVGEDPLRDLIDEFGLTTQPMSGASVIMDGHVLRDLDDVRRIYGDKTWQALREFDAYARQWMNPQEYYESDWKVANFDAVSGKTFYDILAQVPDEAARRYLRTLVHSDLATEPHRTSASYGLQNYLMNHAEYMQLYTIEGGIERLPQELASRIEARLLLQEPVVRVGRIEDEMLRVTSRRDGTIVAEDYDFVVVALPNNYIPLIEWGGTLPVDDCGNEHAANNIASTDDGLAEAMQRHHVHYEYPAHYLRVSILFREPFWRTILQESWLMLDAFGGCCLYDESSRNGHESSGVLGWLLASDAAMTAVNHTDDELIRIVLDSLPAFLQHGRELFVEGHVHRWIGSVNGLPAGVPALEMDLRHIPQPEQPNLFTVGDYLFDSTLNGVLDSADYVAECLTEEIEASWKEASQNAEIPETLHGAA